MTTYMPGYRPQKKRRKPGDGMPGMPGMGGNGMPMPGGGNGMPGVGGGMDMPGMGGNGMPMPGGGMDMPGMGGNGMPGGMEAGGGGTGLGWERPPARTGESAPLQDRGGPTPHRPGQGDMPTTHPGFDRGWPGQQQGGGGMDMPQPQQGGMDMPQQGGGPGGMTGPGQMGGMQTGTQMPQTIGGMQQMGGTGSPMMGGPGQAGPGATGLPGLRGQAGQSPGMGGPGAGKPSSGGSDAAAGVGGANQLLRRNVEQSQGSDQPPMSSDAMDQQQMNMGGMVPGKGVQWGGQQMMPQDALDSMMQGAGDQGAAAGGVGGAMDQLAGAQQGMPGQAGAGQQAAAAAAGGQQGQPAGAAAAQEEEKKPAWQQRKEALKSEVGSDDWWNLDFNQHPRQQQQRQRNAISASLSDDQVDKLIADFMDKRGGAGDWKTGKQSSALHKALEAASRGTKGDPKWDDESRAIFKGFQDATGLTSKQITDALRSSASGHGLSMKDSAKARLGGSGIFDAKFVEGLKQAIADNQYQHKNPDQVKRHGKYGGWEKRREIRQAEDKAKWEEDLAGTGYGSRAYGEAAFQRGQLRREQGPDVSPSQEPAEKSHFEKLEGKELTGDNLLAAQLRAAQGVPAEERNEEQKNLVERLGEGEKEGRYWPKGGRLRWPDQDPNKPGNYFIKERRPGGGQGIQPGGEVLGEDAGQAGQAGAGTLTGGQAGQAGTVGGMEASFAQPGQAGGAMDQLAGQAGQGGQVGQAGQAGPGGLQAGQAGQGGQAAVVPVGQEGRHSDGSHTDRYGVTYPAGHTGPVAMGGPGGQADQAGQSGVSSGTGMPDPASVASLIPGDPGYIGDQAAAQLAQGTVPGTAQFGAGTVGAGGTPQGVGAGTGTLTGGTTPVFGSEQDISGGVDDSPMPWGTEILNQGGQAQADAMNQLALAIGNLQQPQQRDRFANMGNILGGMVGGPMMQQQRGDEEEAPQWASSAIPAETSTVGQTGDAFQRISEMMASAGGGQQGTGGTMASYASPRQAMGTARQAAAPAQAGGGGAGGFGGIGGLIPNRPAPAGLPFSGGGRLPIPGQQQYTSQVITPWSPMPFNPYSDVASTGGQGAMRANEWNQMAMRNPSLFMGVSPQQWQASTPWGGQGAELGRGGGFPGGGGGAGGGGDQLSVPEEYQKAYDEARAANEQRYQDILAGYGELEGQSAERTRGLLEGYQGLGDRISGLTDQNISRIGQMSNEERQRILDQVGGERTRLRELGEETRGRETEGYQNLLARLREQLSGQKGEMMGRLGQRTRDITGQYGALADRYGGRTAEGLRMLEGAGTADEKKIRGRIAEARERELARQQQASMNRGFNTTVGQNLLSGIGKKYGRVEEEALGDLSERIRRERFGAFERLSGAELNAIERKLQAGERLTADEARALEGLQSAGRQQESQIGARQLAGLENLNRQLLSGDVSLAGQGLGQTGAVGQQGLAGQIGTLGTGLAGQMNIGQAGLGALERGGQGLQGIGQNTLNFMERRSDTYPDINQMIGLGQAYGASGGDQGVGGVSGGGMPIGGGGGQQFPQFPWGGGWPWGGGGWPGGGGGAGGQNPPIVWAGDRPMRLDVDENGNPIYVPARDDPPVGGGGGGQQPGGGGGPGGGGQQPGGGGGPGGGGQQPVGQRPEDARYTAEQMDADLASSEEPEEMIEVPETNEGSPIRVAGRIFDWDGARYVERRQVKPEGPGVS